MLESSFSLTSHSLTPRWARFDPKFYGQFDPQAAFAATEGVDAAMDDFKRRGSRLGYSPNIFFDTRYYVTANPEVQPLVNGAKFSSIFAHYAEVGYRDRSPHWLFDLTFYRRSNPDLTDEMVLCCGGAYGHYLEFGDREGRRAHRMFVPALYATKMPHRRDTIARVGAFTDYLQHGMTVVPEVRCSVYFDPVWYRATYKSVDHAVQSREFVCTLEHYLTKRPLERLDPVPEFSEVDYCSLYPDVAQEVTRKRFACGYEHFLEVGADETRSPCSDVNLKYYSTLEVVSDTLQQGKFENCFHHLLEVGVSGGLPTQPPGSLNVAISNVSATNVFLVAAHRALRSIILQHLTFDGVEHPDLDVILLLRHDTTLAIQALADLRSSFSGTINVTVLDCQRPSASTALRSVIGTVVVKAWTGSQVVDDLNELIAKTRAQSVLLIEDGIRIEGKAVESAVGQLTEAPDRGAVGAKILQPNGLLYEAGGIVLRDGTTSSWLRGAPSETADANYVREVDYCSPCFLLLRGDILRKVGGFTPAFSARSFQAAELSLRMKRLGFRTIYDPGAVVVYLEYPSEVASRRAATGNVEDQAAFHKIFASTLMARPWGLSQRELANFCSRSKRILFITDRLPLSDCDVPGRRASAIITLLVNVGWQVTVFLAKPRGLLDLVSSARLSKNVEVVLDEDLSSLSAFIAGRSGYYALVWQQRVAAQHDIIDILSSSLARLGDARLLLDMGHRLRTPSPPFDFVGGQCAGALQLSLKEKDYMLQCNHIVTAFGERTESVNGGPQASVTRVGFPKPALLQVRSFNERLGVVLLFVEEEKALIDDEVRKFCGEVMPLINAMAKTTIPVSILSIDEQLASSDWPCLDDCTTGPRSPKNLEAALATALVTVAVGRYTPAIGGTIQLSAWCGTPVVSSAATARHLGWSASEMAVVAEDALPALVAEVLVNLCLNEVLWLQLQAAASEALSDEGLDGSFEVSISAAIDIAMATETGNGCQSNLT